MVKTTVSFHSDFSSRTLPLQWGGVGQAWTPGPLPRGDCVRDRFGVGSVGRNHGACSHLQGRKVIAGHAGPEVPSRPAPAPWHFLLSLQGGTGLKVMGECELVLWPPCGECTRGGGGGECVIREARNQPEESSSSPRSCELSVSRQRCAFHRCLAGWTLCPDRPVMQRCGHRPTVPVSPFDGNCKKEDTRVIRTPVFTNTNWKPQ